MTVTPFHRDPDILGGVAVFNGTRVPIQALWDHLESGVGLDAFLDDFPSVSRAQAIALLEMAREKVEADASASR